jgi:hypothetical protein
MPKFQVNTTLVITRDKDTFVIMGSIVEGAIREGMFVHIPLNSSVAVTARIDCIEFARVAGGREDICLCIIPDDAEELDFLKALNIGNETLEISADGTDYDLNSRQFVAQKEVKVSLEWSW